MFYIIHLESHRHVPLVLVNVNVGGGCRTTAGAGLQPPVSLGMSAK